MRPDSLAMIKKLVGFDTTSSKSNLNLVDFVVDYLGRHGVQGHLIHDADGQKANLYATVGPQHAGGVVLSGHTDVVPVDGQPWSSDPFAVRQQGGRLYGRGTADMKSFIAVALAQVPSLLAAGLQRPVHFAFSYDEEVGCLGAPAMIDELLHAIAPPAAVIVGEPSSMRPVMAHKGMAVLRTTVTGHEAHSSQVHRGVSAIMTAARLVEQLSQMTAVNKAEAGASPFVPPYTSLHVGLIRGGTAPNIISRECVFHWDVRLLPGDSLQHFVQEFQASADSLLPALRRIAPEVGIQTELLTHVPAMAADGDPAAQQLLLALTDAAECGVVPYASEGGQFQEKGFSVAICGPGSIDQAHQPDEYIEIGQVERYEQFLDRLTMHLAAPLA